MREKFFKDTKDDLMEKLKNKKIYLYGMPNTWEKLVLDLRIRKNKKKSLHTSEQEHSQCLGEAEKLGRTYLGEQRRS